MNYIFFFNLELFDGGPYALFPTLYAQFFPDLEEGGKYKKVAYNTEINDTVH